MTEYPETIKKLRDLELLASVCGESANCADCSERETCDNYSNDTLGAIYKSGADAIEALQKELRLCRNELCQHCGEYIREYAGACDGCRWYAKERLEE